MADVKRVEDLDDDDDDNENTHVWEQPLERSWDQIKEDEKGELKALQVEQQRARLLKQQQLREEADGQTGSAGATAVEKGVIRYVYLILDKSKAMDVVDLKPSRLLASLQLLEQFIKDFFDQNPISQLGSIVSYEKRADRVTELSGNPKQQIANIRAHSHDGGLFSLQNALLIAKDALRQMPSYGSREVLIVMGSLGTTDPGDILQTIAELKQHRIRCSVISLSASVRVCSYLAQETQGAHDVALNKRHFQELLSKHVPPQGIPRAQRQIAKKWVKMGFPQKRDARYASLCGCHGRFEYDGYECPRCETRYCELPTDCQVCKLTLVSSPHLARSYHHLFPVRAFPAVNTNTGDAASAASSTVHGDKNCFACGLALESSQNLLSAQCSLCRCVFCSNCDHFIHESLHNCPGCLSSSSG